MMQEPRDTIENALYNVGWDEPLPAVMYQDLDVLDPDDEAYYDLEAQQEAVKKQFVIGDTDRANRALRRIKQARGHRRQIEEDYARELGRLKSWKDKAFNVVDKEERFFTGVLRDYAHDELAHSDGKRRSIALSEGTLKFRKLDPQLAYQEDKLIEELEAQGAELLLRRKVELDLNAIKKAVKDGFESEHITAIKQADSFKVAVND